MDMSDQPADYTSGVPEVEFVEPAEPAGPLTTGRVSSTDGTPPRARSRAHLTRKVQPPVKDTPEQQ